MRNGLVMVLLAALAAACGDPVPVIEPAPDGGQPLEDGGSPPEDDAGPPDLPEDLPPGQVGGSICDQQDACDDCRQCSHAPRETCNDLALTCEATPACQALVVCLQSCTSEACQRDCAEAHRPGLDLVLEVIRCEVCDACPRDCAEHASICEGGEFVPF